MTTLAVLSDIHGNLPALEAVMNDLAKTHVDQIVVAGDVINWGPFSAECFDIVARERWPVIRGNNEYYLLDYDTPRAPDAWRDKTQWPLLPWLREQLQGRRLNAIAAWPDFISMRFPDGPPIRVVHGTCRSAWESLFANDIESVNLPKLANVDEPFVIAGHTHIAMDIQVDRWRVFNPGTVGVPMDGTFSAQYMLLRNTGDGWKPEFRRVAYDRSSLFEAFEQQAFASRCGVMGQMVLDEFHTARVVVVPFLSWRNAECAGELITPELYEAFKRTDTQQHAPPAYRAQSQINNRS
jgi:predicted phosphodiesterase